MVNTGLLLLDVDGPLNPWRRRSTNRPAGYRSYRYTAHGAWYSGREVRRHKGLLVWLNPDHGAQLIALAADTGLELTWATTWQHDANRCIGPAIGLPELPVIEFPAEHLNEGPRGRWKWPAITAYAAGRPLAWLDDEHHSALGRTEFEAARGDLLTYLVHIDPATGLRPADLDAIRARWNT